MSKISMLFPYVIEYFMQGRRSSSSLLYKITGSLLIIIGGVIGSYSLFNYMVPIIGFNESGIAIFFILTCIGIVLLSISGKKKNPEPGQEVLKLLHNFQDQINLPGFLKENGKKVLVFSVIGGILLSQLMKAAKR